jgi:hypothetical protein
VVPPRPTPIPHWPKVPAGPLQMLCVASACSVGRRKISLRFLIVRCALPASRPHFHSPEAGSDRLVRCHPGPANGAKRLDSASAPSRISTGNGASGVVSRASIPPPLGRCVPDVARSGPLPVSVRTPVPCSTRRRGSSVTGPLVRHHTRHHSHPLSTIRAAGGTLRHNCVIAQVARGVVIMRHEA